MELTGRLHPEVVINRDSGSKTVFGLCGTLSPLYKHFIPRIVVPLYSGIDQCNYSVCSKGTLLGLCIVLIG